MERINLLHPSLLRNHRKRMRSVFASPHTKPRELIHLLGGFLMAMAESSTAISYRFTDCLAGRRSPGRKECGRRTIRLMQGVPTSQLRLSRLELPPMGAREGSVWMLAS